MRSLSLKTVLLSLALPLSMTLPVAAADFGFAVVIRAGDQVFGPPQYEIGIGSTSTSLSSTLSLTQSFLSAPGPRNFEIGYRNPTNTAFLRVYNSTGTSFQEVTFSPAGGGVPEPTRLWTLPGSALRVQANPTQVAGFPMPGGVTVDQLTLTGALSVLQPLSTTSMTATQDGVTGGTATIGPNVVFLDSGTGVAGDWTLTGRIQFSGAGAVLGNPDRLNFGFGANAGQVPEPGTFLLAGIALIGLYLFRGRPKSPSGLKRSA